MKDFVAKVAKLFFFSLCAVSHGRRFQLLPFVDLQTEVPKLALP